MTQIPDRQQPNTNIANTQDDFLIKDLESIEDREDTNLRTKRNFKPLLSIRSKLLLFVMPTLFVSLLAIGAIASLLIKKNSAKQLAIQSENQALLASKATSTLLQKNFKIPEILARNTLILEAFSSTNNQNTETNQEFNQLNSYLRNLAEIGEAKEISIVTLGGDMIASTLEISEFLAENSDWWELVKEEKSISYSNTNQKEIDLIVKIKDPTNKNFIGTIKYTIASAKINEITDYIMRSGIEFSPTQRVDLVDSRGNVILTVTGLGASNNPEKLGENVNKIGRELVELLINISQEPTARRQEEKIEDKQKELSEQYSINNLEIKYQNFNTNDNRSQSELVLIASFQEDNKKYYISTIPQQINWLAIASIQESEIASASQEASLTLLATSAIVTIIGILATLWLARQLSLPLNKLARTSQQITLGDLNLTADTVVGTTETKILAENLNNLVIQLKSLLSQQISETRQSRLIAEISSCPSLNKQEAEITIERAIKRAREILKVERMLIYRLKDDESGYISQEALIQPYPSSIFDENSLTEAFVTKKTIPEYRQGKVLAINDIASAKLDPQQIKLMERLKVRASLTIPILTRGGLYGLVIAHHCQCNYNWQEKEIIFSKQLAAQLGLLLERVAFLEERKEETERSQHLKNITIKISGAIEAEEILETTVTESREVLKADRVIMYSFDGNRKGTIIAESVLEEWPEALGDEIINPGFIEQFLDNYQKAGVQAIPDIYQENLDQFHIEQMENYQVKAKLIAPVLMGGELRGLLIAHQCSAPRNWEKAEIDFLNQVANQVGLALERANLLEQQRDAREYLQERALELLREVDPLSKGDLTIRARVTEDEIGTIAYSYNATIENLQEIVDRVKTASSRVTATADRNQISVEALSNGAISQRQQIEAALQEIKAMNSSIHAVAVNAEQAEAKVKQASTKVEEGERAMNRTVAGIMTIQETVSATAEKVKQLGKSSQKISQVVNLISTFAAQTNLLALKTSLEAARAGEEGRGFAVIADEIRSLAAQSAEKSDEIEKLVAKIQAETNEVVEAMEAGTSQVVSGSKLVDETRSSLEKISLVSNQIESLVEDIAKVAVKQAKTSQVVTERIAEVAKISNQTSTEAEQVSESFQELLAVAQSLQESIGQFKVA